MKYPKICAAMTVAVLCLFLFLLPCAAEETIDNSALIPPYRDGDDVQLLDGGTPDWLSESIFVEVRAEMCNGCTVEQSNGTFADMRRVVDHYAEMGVNAFWMTPIPERPYLGEENYSFFNGYGGFGPHTIASSLTGTTDYAKGRAELKKLVDYAHSKGVRILVDVVPWGVNFSAPIHDERPELFAGQNGWGGWGWNWNSEKTVQFWLDTLTTLVCETGIDGYRCDCEPDYSGYKLFGKVKDACAERGHKIAVMSEGQSLREKNGEVVYDLEQMGVNTLDYISSAPNLTYLNDIFYKHSIVDMVKEGEYIGLPAIWENKEPMYRYYTFTVSCHDNPLPLLQNRDFYAAYGGFFSPFIPLWYMGEEWNNPKQCGGTGVLYFNRIQWDKLDKNRALYERMKKYIRIARTYPELFFHYEAHIYDANICGVEVKNGDESLVPYARYADGKAALILPNTDDAFAIRPTVTIPYEEAGLTDPGEYIVTDLLTGKKVAEGTKEKFVSFKAEVAPETCGVYLVTPKKAAAPTTKPTPASTTTKTAARPTAEEGGKTDPTAVTDPTDPTEPETDPATTEPMNTEVPTEAPETEIPGTEEPATEKPDDDEKGGLPLGAVIGIAAGVAVIIAAVVLILPKKKG